MATTWIVRMVWAIVMGMGLVVGSAFAEDHAFNFNDEVKKGEEQPGFSNKMLVKAPTYTVGAVAVKDEIDAHRHHMDGNHQMEWVKWRGPQRSNHGQGSTGPDSSCKVGVWCGAGIILAGLAPVTPGDVLAISPSSAVHGRNGPEHSASTRPPVTRAPPALGAPLS